MPQPRFTALLLVVVSIGVISAQAPTFKTGVEMLRLDVTVVGENGLPVDDLDAADFDVRVGGRAATVRSLQYLDLRPKPFQLPPGTSLSASRDFTANDTSTIGRLLVIVVDQDSLPFGAGRSLLESAAALLNGLGAQDRVALITIPPPGPQVDFTSDVRRVQRALFDVTGRTNARYRLHRITFEEAVAVDRGNQIVVRDLVDRQCRFLNRQAGNCASEIREEARFVLLEGRERIQTTLAALSNVAASLRDIDGPKTLVLLSAGLGYEEESVGRFKALARDAADARLLFYIVYADTFEFDAGQALQSAAFTAGSGRRGLETISGLTGGALLQAVGSGSSVFQKIVHESQGSYVLGIEPPVTARRDATLRVDVRVKRRGVTVRSPRQLVPPAPRVAPSNTERALAYTLQQPRPAKELPVRVSTYTLRAKAPDRLRVRVVAEFPESDVPPNAIAWALAVLDQDRVVADVADTLPASRPPRSTSRNALNTEVEVFPGEYTLRFAAIDPAGRRGSIERPLTAGLRDAGAVQLSDLMVGSREGDGLEPLTELADRDKGITMALELYSARPAVLDDAAVEFVLRGADGASRGVQRVRPVDTDSDIRRAEATLPVTYASPGAYSAEATILVGGRAVGKVKRGVFLGTASP